MDCPKAHGPQASATWWFRSSSPWLVSGHFTRTELVGSCHLSLWVKLFGKPILLAPQDQAKPFTPPCIRAGKTGSHSLTWPGRSRAKCWANRWQPGRVKTCRLFEAPQGCSEVFPMPCVSLFDSSRVYDLRHGSGSPTKPALRLPTKQDQIKQDHLAIGSAKALDARRVAELPRNTRDQVSGDLRDGRRVSPHSKRAVPRVAGAGVVWSVRSGRKDEGETG